MKKTFFGLMAMCALLLTSCKDKAAASADGEKNTTEAAAEETGLEGTWVADAKSVMEAAGEDIAKAFQKCECILELDGETMTMNFDMYGTIEEGGLSMTLGLKADLEAGYTSTDNTLTADMTNAKPSIDLYKFEIAGDEKTVEAMKAAGMDEETMKKAMKEQMSPDSFKEMYKSMEQAAKYTMPDNNTLIITDENGKDMKFTRK